MMDQDRVKTRMNSRVQTEKFDQRRQCLRASEEKGKKIRMGGREDEVN